MKHIGWLHLTDLHCGMTAQETLWSNARVAFFNDLEKMHSRSGPWDVLFFTGDLVNKGQASEFNKLNGILRRLREKLNQLGSDPVFLAVPGNHDLTRPDKTDPSVKILNRWRQEYDMHEKFWHDPASSYRKILDGAFKNYTDWFPTNPFKKPDYKGFTKGILPGEFSATVVVNDILLGVVGLNTTFLQLSEGNYINRLAVSPEQLVAVCGEEYNDWFEKHSFCMLMTHQPPSWLNKESQHLLKGEIALPGRFLAHMYGHLHEPSSYNESVGGDEVKRFWQGCSLFGLERIAGTRNSCRLHGYSAGCIKYDSQGGDLRLWPRQATKTEAGRWEFRAAPAAVELDEGMRAERIAIRTIVSTPDLQKFKVLLLSTQIDLEWHRGKVSDHLINSLGVDVIDGLNNGIVDASGYDWTVLIQGRRWESGQVAGIWRSARGTQRSAYVVSGESDWPPYRMAEFTANDAIDKFLTELESPAFFDDPIELPGLVASDVSAAMEKMQGGPSVGIREWERLYLNARLPIWSGGRTTGGRVHLIEAENAQELYQADLYIPLDGASQQWYCAKDENLTTTHLKRVHDVKNNEVPAIAEFLERRAPLAMWLSVPEISRLAIVGAPGGGKTVFLTRIAAALAHVCLGHANVMEPDLNIEGLRQHIGALPIPIVLESTHLARHIPSGHVALARAIHEEIEATGTGAIDIQDVVKSISTGRYLLLIDALDEIADPAQRSKVLDILKGLSAFPKARCALTTRSARYTGSLAFGPELEIVSVEPLSERQVQKLCGNWSRRRQHKPDMQHDLMAAVSGLSDQVSSSGEDGTLSENPLMLTAICMIFERHRSLPDDRGRLCDLLIDDLCKSRSSHDTERKWRLEESGKKNLLQRIALKMQEEGAQTWRLDQAVEIVLGTLPSANASRHQQAKKYLDWTAEHTGLLRFQQEENGAESIRFWHRLFREYLAANQIAQRDMPTSDITKELWDQERLIDPFWEDVVRLLPRTLGTQEKAESLYQTLNDLSANTSNHRGRLLGLGVAGIIENRDLFPKVDFSGKAKELASLYEREGLGWPLRDRLLFLEGLGRLDPDGHDPRLSRECWIDVPEGVVMVEAEDGDPVQVARFAAAWAPVTVQEYYSFVTSDDYKDPQFWEEAQVELTGDDMEKENDLSVVRRQMQHPNWPIIGISYCEATAYCKWKTKHRGDGRIVRLPTSAEWVRMWQMDSTLQDGQEWPSGQLSLFNWPKADINHPSPVGAFPVHKSGVVDLVGNVFEFTCDLEKIVMESEDRNFAYGGAFDAPDQFFRRSRLDLPGVDGGYDVVGFRCVYSY